MYMRIERRNTAFKDAVGDQPATHEDNLKLGTGEKNRYVKGNRVMLREMVEEITDHVQEYKL